MIISALQLSDPHHAAAGPSVQARTLSWRQGGLDAAKVVDGFMRNRVTEGRERGPKVCLFGREIDVGIQYLYRGMIHLTVDKDQLHRQMRHSQWPRAAALLVWTDRRVLSRES